MREKIRDDEREQRKDKLVKKKVANLNSNILYEMGDAVKVQKAQLNSIEAEKDAIEDGTEKLHQMNDITKTLRNESEGLMDELFSMMENGSVDQNIVELLSEPIVVEPKESNHKINKVKSVRTENEWEHYKNNFYAYAKEQSLNTEVDPFNTLLSQREYEELQKEINDDFAKKTSIKNKTDLKFLAIAIALQVTKALLFPLISEKIGYGQSFDKDARMAENDKSIIQKEQESKNEYVDKVLSKGNEKGEWMEFLYRTPPYDITKGSPALGINMEGRYHRIHTLGHDPILGWVFGTANILTDTITFDTFSSYKVARNPMVITPEKVPFLVLFKMAISKIKESPLNLPAALVAEKIHLKSDEFTKCGLPIPVLETFAPDFAGTLYKNQYDKLCFSRDLKIIGISATISLLIDMIIGLTHALYYDKDRDGTRNLFEVRTRKILLISNTIASTSNIVFSMVTKNPKGLDIGGLLVTIMHLFSDSKFILNVKKEFIENRIYEKIENELKAINENQEKLLSFEYNHIL